MHTATHRPDGLALLTHHRRAAADAYLQMLGTLGGSLDLSTRHLILIALQVTQGSRRALRRHVPRALEAGASSDQVVDAILMTLPVVGLTRTTEALADVADLLGIKVDAEP